jgi:phosphohistidine swiveling domain-containing protein
LQALKTLQQTYRHSHYGAVVHLPYGNIFPFNKNTYLDLTIEGVGTKVLIAQLAEKFDSIGIDAVAMAVNDVIRSGATPLALVDNFHVHVSDPKLVKEWLKGVDATAGADVSEIKGFASSAGVAEGPARVLKMLKDIVDLQPGEVLVCPSTNPSWAPVFTNIKAAVTDIGGLTSHAAIVCREYGVPSVTGCGIATAAIKTGDIVKVDGDSGVVTIVERAS